MAVYLKSNEPYTKIVEKLNSMRNSRLYLCTWVETKCPRNSMIWIMTVEIAVVKHALPLRHCGCFSYFHITMIVWKLILLEFGRRSVSFGSSSPNQCQTRRFTLCRLFIDDSINGESFFVFVMCELL